MATDFDWSFQNHPHPTRDERTGVEKSKWVGLLPTAAAQGNSCEIFIEFDFQLYHDRYPDFVSSGGEAERYLAWADHIVESSSKYDMDPEGLIASCIADSPYGELVSFLEKTGPLNIRFCGVYLHPPNTDEERQFAAILDSWIRYGLMGSTSPMFGLLKYNFPHDPIKLNWDVAYYFRRYLQTYGEPMFDWSVEHLLPSATQERIEFVEQALVRSDLKSVLETTAPCTPPKQ